jgi:hypothetical protein
VDCSRPHWIGLYGTNYLYRWVDGYVISSMGSWDYLQPSGNGGVSRDIDNEWTTSGASDVGLCQQTINPTKFYTGTLPQWLGTVRAIVNCNMIVFVFLSVINTHCTLAT